MGGFYDRPKPNLITYSRLLNISVDALIELQVKTHGVTCLFDATRFLKFSKLYLIKVDFGAMSMRSGRYHPMRGRRHLESDSDAIHSQIFLLYHDISPSIGRYKRATRLIKADSFIELGQF